MPEDIMNAAEIAAYLGIAKATVYKWVEYRQIPYTKIGTLLRFPKWIIDRWLAEKAVRPEESLLEEFARLYQRYHLQEFLKSKGLDYNQMTEQQLLTELAAAIEALKTQNSDDPTGPR